MTLETHAPAVFIGDVALDEYFEADHWVMPGNKALIRTLESFIGGSIANAARVHASFTGDTEFVSLLNHGELTTKITDVLTKEGVAVPHMLYDDEIGDQRNLIFLVEGEHIVFTPDVDERPMVFSSEQLAEISCPGFVYTTLSRARRLRSEVAGTEDLDAAGVLRELLAAGRKVVFDLDVDGLEEDGAELLRGAYVIMMNDRGFEKSFGEEASEDVVRAWMAANEVTVLLRSRAAAGATTYTADETIVTTGYTVPVVDVTGAGDTLGGALVYALGAGWPLAGALEFAIAAASRSVMHMGPNGGITTLDEVEKFSAEYAAVSVGASE